MSALLALLLSAAPALPAHGELCALSPPAQAQSPAQPGAAPQARPVPDARPTPDAQPVPALRPDAPAPALRSDAPLASAPGPRSDVPLAAAPDAPTPNWRVPVAHSAGLLLGMRVALSVAWPRAYDPSRLGESARSLQAAYTHAPEFHRGVPLLESDGDPLLLNTVGHGFFGSEVYGRTRQCGHGPLASLAAAAVASTVWEYGPEALHQRPSALDLVWTPLAGALLGEGRFQLHRLVRGQGERPGALRQVLLFVLDPLGETERRALGADC